MRTARTGLALGLALGLAVAASAEEPAFDWVLRGAQLYRGGAQPLVPGDVALRGDRIAAVGAFEGRGRREVDATGLIVAPGFIDLHNHTDALYAMVDWLPLPSAMHANRNYVTQGVTTIVTGNCGSGPAAPEAVGAWLEEVEALPFGSNVVHLVPHGQLRLDALGGNQAARADPAPSAAELDAMKKALHASLRAGAFGLSTGLEYDPGARADTDELVALARVVSSHGGLYASHTRHEGPDPERMLASYGEAIAIGERGGVPAHISHIKLSGAAVHGRTGDVIALVEAARARGVAVTADQYPYPAGSTGLSALAPVALRDAGRVLPEHCANGGSEALRRGIEASFAEDQGPDRVLVALYPWRWWLQGKTIAEIASERGSDPVDVAVEVACGWYGAGVYFSQSEADVRAFMQQAWVATASDGAAMHPLFRNLVHPRLYGTFPRKLRRYAIDEAVVSLPEALRSMTDLPADILGLAQRGRLQPGAFADLVAFDPATLRDHATFEQSGNESEGIRWLWVNGVAAIEDGRWTGERAGRALRLGRDGSPIRAATPAPAPVPPRREPPDL